MPDVSVTREHNLEADELRTRIENLANEMSQKFGIKCRWDGDICHLSGNPLKNGKVTMGPTSVSLELNLGMMAKMLKGAITKEVNARLDKLLA